MLMKTQPVSNSNGQSMQLTGEQVRQRRLKEMAQKGYWTMTPEDLANSQRRDEQFLNALKEGVRNKVWTP